MQQARIYLGSESTRCSAFKKENLLKTDREVATFLIDQYGYTAPIYCARNRLAALDHYLNLDRAPIMYKDGSVRLHRVWNKKSGRWSVHEENEKKKYDYTDVLKQALVRRIEDNIGMRKSVMEEDNPRRISAHFVPVEPKPSQDIPAVTISRFRQQ